MFRDAWTLKLPDTDITSVLFAQSGGLFVSTSTERCPRAVKVDVADPANPREWCFNPDTMGSIYRIDPSGEIRWSRTNLTGIAVLAGDLVLAIDSEKQFVYLEGDGNTTGQTAGKPLLRYLMWREGDPLLLADQDEIALLNPQTRRIEEGGSIPEGVSPGSSWFLAGKFYWSDESKIMRAAPGREPEQFAEVAPALLEQALGRLAQRLDIDNRGPEAMMAFTEAARQVRKPHWYVVDDERRGRLFAYHNRDPHIVCAIDTAGSVEWCEVLGGGCCGHSPQYLGDDIYASSLACGGVVTWSDSRGRILAQSEPAGGATLGSSLGGLAVAPTGRLFAIQGDSLILAWDRRGRRLGETRLDGFPWPSLACEPKTEGVVVWSMAPRDAAGSRITFLNTGGNAG